MSIKFKQQEFTFLNPLRHFIPFSFEWYFLEWVLPTTVVGFDLKILNFRYRFEVYREIIIPEGEQYFKGSLDLDNDKFKLMLIDLKALKDAPFRDLDLSTCIYSQNENETVYRVDDLEMTIKKDNTGLIYIRKRG